MGVRGTEFLANEFEQTEVALLSGTLLMTNLKNQTSNELTASHYYIRNDSKTKIERLPQAELIRLKSEHIKEEEEFKPFLERQKIEAEKITSIADLIAELIYYSKLNFFNYFRKLTIKI